jgi:2-polyprenyl-6-methoxyphenol hydroxylase-like FAD-dependent oxidoreductase
MTPPERIDVLVIGAGPVGLTMACELKRHGVPVRIIERKDKPLYHPNAAIVHVRTLEILSAMGAVTGFIEQGYAFPGVQAHLFGQPVGMIDLHGVDSPFPLPRTIPQHETERLLNEQFERLGGRVERRVEAVGIEQDEQEARVRLRYLAEEDREETVVARWVIGCEGSASISREACGIDFTGERYTGKEFLQVDATVRWSFPSGPGYQFLTDDYVLFLAAYNDQGFYRIICARNDADPENREPPTLDEMQELVRKIADPCAELTDARWFNRFRTGYRLASRFREGRVFLAGDAGHVHVPIGGQGMNYGMHDAFNLAWKLAAVIKKEAPAHLLDTYMTERYPADEALVRGTDRSFHLLVKPHPVLRSVLKFLGPMLLKIPAIQKRIRETLGEINVAYRTSALSRDYGGSHGPAAGDRAPDATGVRLPEGTTAHLFEVLHGTRWSLLLFAGHAPGTRDIERLERISASLARPYGTRVAAHLVLCGEPPVPVHENWAAHVFMDRDRAVHEKYGVDDVPCLYLIRPDGYVAFRGGLDQHAELTAYLERTFTLNMVDTDLGRKPRCRTKRK